MIWQWRDNVKCSVIGQFYFAVESCWVWDIFNVISDSSQLRYDDIVASCDSLNVSIVGNDFK